MLASGARIKETSATTGTATYVLDGAQTGFQAFSVLGAGNLCEYFATDGTGWEEGIGTVLTGPNRLERTHVLRSSNSNNPVSWVGAGPRTLRCGPISAFGVPRVVSKSVAGASDVTLTQSEQRCSVLTLTGALTGNISVIFDTTPWELTVINETTGNFTLTVKVAGQPGAESYQGRASRYANNGVDMKKAGDDPPPGIILDYAASAVISGYALACDGANVSRTGANSALFNKVGTTWGVGDGSTTFAVPDLRRRATIGSGGTAVSGPANTVGSVGGSETHTLSQAETPVKNHNHTLNFSDPGHPHGQNYSAAGDAQGPAFRDGGGSASAVEEIAPSDLNANNTRSNTRLTTDSATTGISVSANAASDATANAHPNMQPSAVVTKMIKL